MMINPDIDTWQLIRAARDVARADLAPKNGDYYAFNGNSLETRATCERSIL